MKIKQVDYKEERKILIGLIVSDEFCKEVIPELKLSYFKSKAARTVVQWCVDYFNKYSAAPKQEIQTIFEDKAAHLDEDVVLFIKELLVTLNNEYLQDPNAYNAGYYIDKAFRYFKRRQVEELRDTVEALLESDQVEQAEKLIINFKAVERKTVEAIDPFEDDTLVKEALVSTTEPLFYVPSPLGDLLNNQFYRASFIAFQGPEKSGKTWLLQELMLYALKYRRRVAFFECGDLTKEQRLCRLYSRLARRPWIPGRTEGTIRVYVPNIEDLTPDTVEDFADFVDSYDILEKEVPVLTVDDATTAWSKYGPVFKGLLRVSIHTNSTLSVRAMDRLLEEWEQKDDWIPDVIIVDYADIMTTDEKGLDTRTQTNIIWKGLRALSQKWNVCLITATQADAKSDDKTTQTLSNFSEDKRKYSHVTGIFAINRTQEERQVGAFRIAPLLIREGVIAAVSKQVGIFMNPETVEVFWKMFWTSKPLA